MEAVLTQVEIELKRLSTLCRIMQIIFIILAALVLVLTLATAYAAIRSPNSSMFEGDLLASVVIASLHQVIFIAILCVCAYLFSGVAKGEPPFTKKSVLRIRALGWLFLLIAIVDCMLPGSTIGATSTPIGQMAFESDSASYGTIDIVTLVTAIAFFCLAAIFKYGALLQQDSDDTV